MHNELLAVCKQALRILDEMDTVQPELANLVSTLRRTIKKAESSHISA